MPTQNPSPLLPPVLAGICLGMVCSVPVAALLASWVGDTYQSRVLVYGCTLLWCIVGAFTVYFTSTRVRFQTGWNLFTIVRFCVMLWIWPVVWIITRNRSPR